MLALHRELDESFRGPDRSTHREDVGEAIEYGVAADAVSVIGLRIERVHLAIWTCCPGSFQRVMPDMRADIDHASAAVDDLPDEFESQRLGCTFDEDLLLRPFSWIEIH